MIRIFSRTSVAILMLGGAACAQYDADGGRVADEQLTRAAPETMTETDSQTMGDLPPRDGVANESVTRAAPDNLGRADASMGDVPEATGGDVDREEVTDQSSSVFQ